MHSKVSALRNLKLGIGVFIITSGIPLHSSEVASPAFHAGDRWCAIGDSATHSGDWTRLVYLFYITRFPEDRFEFINCGTGGDTAPGALLRFDWDIATTRPTISTIMFGLNDVWWEHNKLIGPDDYIHSIETLVDRLKAMNSRVLLIAPPPYDSTVQSSTPLDPLRAGLERYVKQLREYTERQRIPLLDFFQPMIDLSLKMQAADPTFTLFNADRVHANESGQLVMAYLFLKRQKCPALVSDIVLDARQKTVVRKENCQLKNVQFSGREILFSALEKSLPFPLQGLSEESLNLVPFVKDLDREMLQVTALPTGHYELSMDNVPIGIWSHEELAQGVNLAQAFKSPQNRQAQKIAQLSNEHHLIISQKLRYIAMLEHGELKKQYPVDNVAEPKKGIEVYLSRITSEKQAAESKKMFDKYLEYKSQQSKLMKEADVCVDKMYSQNKPVWHSYRIRLKASSLPLQSG